MYWFAIVIFWASLAGILYTYVGYPVLLAVLTRVRGKRSIGTPDIPNASRPVRTETSEPPRITVLISAFNAASYLRQRIENILASDYPADRLRVVVASDGSTDETVSVVEQLGNDAVTAVAFGQRRGKVETLIDAMKSVESDVVVFTDASTHFEPGTLRALSRHFSDRTVGLVSGKPVMVDQEGRPAESIYWRSELAMRRREIELGILLGASGAVYAVRRELFVAPCRPVIHDDLVIPTLIHLKHRCRVIFEPEARAHVSNSGGISTEFRRRVRIGSGAVQSLLALPMLWHRMHYGTAIAFVSRKLLRWFCPLLMLGLLFSNAVLASQSGYDWFLRLQVVGYGAALMAPWLPSRSKFVRVAQAGSSFVFMNVALLLGLLRWGFQPRTVIWQPTSRVIRPLWSEGRMDVGVSHASGNRVRTPAGVIRSTSGAVDRVVKRSA